MVVIEVQLLSGRYHAHVWGESQFAMAGPEWPPSPWRLLRALAAAWFAGQSRVSSEADRDALLETLGQADPPELWLPKSSFHEIRYYQPIRMGGSDRVLHHDLFAIPEGGRFWFSFNVPLNDSQRGLLSELLRRFRYFGRSESRARLCLADLSEPPDGVQRVVPRDPTQQGSDVVYRRVLCAAPDFRPSDLWAVRDDASGKAKPAESRKKESRELASGDDPSARAEAHPPHLVDRLIEKKMPLPSGARWVEYAVPATILVQGIGPRPRPVKPQPEVKVSEICFRLSRRIPIPVQSLVAVARKFRDAVVARHRENAGTHSLTLTGREADGSVARGHRHAYYLPRLSEGRPTIDSLIVHIPEGCVTRAELDALLSVSRIHVDGSAYPISVVPERILHQPLCRQEATRWRSVTPFIPPLHHRLHRDQTSVEEQVAVAAERHCGVRPSSVQVTTGPGGLGRVSPMVAHEYFDDVDITSRRWVLTRRLGFWLEITFAEPVLLDVPLGGDAHFGAGQFKPC